MQTIELVRQQLLDKYDADDLVDILNIDAEELLDRFEDKVIDRMVEQETEDELDEG